VCEHWDCNGWVAKIEMPEGRQENIQGKGEPARCGLALGCAPSPKQFRGVGNGVGNMGGIVVRKDEGGVGNVGAVMVVVEVAWGKGTMG
jgi:hypothetical protein